MPTTEKLADRDLEGLQKKPGRWSDGHGLFLRVLPGEKAYWTYRFRIGGREREMSLGVYPLLSLAEARVRHLELRRRVVIDKIDPLALKQAAKASAAAMPTFGEVADDYLAAHEASWSNPKHRQQWRQSLMTDCAPLRPKPVDQIDTKAVIKTLMPVWTRAPETGRRLRARIEAVLDLARVRGHIGRDAPNPARWRGHLDKAMPRRRRGPTSRAAMPYADAPTFMAKLAVAPGVGPKALAFAILTVTRTDAALGARWEEIDFETATWTVPAARMKMRRAFRVPLSPAAAEILRGQLKTRGPKQAFVFESPVAQGSKVHRSGAHQRLSPMAMAMAMRRLGARQFTVHGFLSTFCDWASEVGRVEEAVAERCLGHVIVNKVRRVYARSDLFELRRPVMDEWSRYLSAVVERDANAKAAALAAAADP
jgi:integrase